MDGLAVHLCYLKTFLKGIVYHLRISGEEGGPYSVGVSEYGFCDGGYNGADE